ncbi:DUF2470 domain-containing protein [Streptomyces sp. NPDC088354]|uniref:DUF2470 domain-containing protein n=1 Tax=Streptomyces sp. NPDC088354 TaxID=3365856 RepID=UPI00382419D9
MRSMFHTALAAPVRPSSAERIRSVLASAHSMTVVTGHGRAEVSRPTAADLAGHLHLHPLDTALPRPESVPATLEFTDVAPTPVRERVRARVTVTGRLAAPYRADAADSQCLEFAQAVLETEDGRSTVALEELVAAAADPLATCEAGMLTHLVDDHQELVPLLMRLVRPVPAPGAQRVLPLAVDRYGITLRIEYPRVHRDVRLPFASPLDSADQAGGRIQALLSGARRSSHLGHPMPGW